jgi:poly(beta-D-mannuronate) lyase
MGLATGRLILAVLLCTHAAPAGAQQAGFASPYSMDMQMRRSAAPVRTCPEPPPPVRDLRIESVFAGGDYARQVPERVARRQALTGDLHRYVGDVVELSDRALLLTGHAREQAGACVLDWLEAWLRHGALLGDVTWPEGDYERQWVSIALGMSLLKLYAGRPVEAPGWARDWYVEASAGLRERFPLTAETRNNHWYWAGLASVVAGTIADDPSRYDWGIAQMRAGIADVDADGYLPEELKRGALSLRYSAFAAGALVVMAAFEQANGRPLPAEQSADLQRLVRRVLSSLTDPREIARRAGTHQENFDPPAVRLLAWLEVYDALTHDPQAEPWLRHLRPMKLIWLGGDLTMAFGARLPPGPIARSPLIDR